jgi:hypothetical protein
VQASPIFFFCGSNWVLAFPVPVLVGSWTGAPLVFLSGKLAFTLATFFFDNSDSARINCKINHVSILNPQEINDLAW